MEKKPVYCAHPGIECAVGQTQFFDCRICGFRIDPNHATHTRVPIGYIEAGEEAGGGEEK